MVAAVAAAAVRAEEGAAPVVALLHRAVLVVGKLVLRAHVLGAALEAEDAALAVVTGEERRPRDAEEGLRREKERDGRRQKEKMLNTQKTRT